MKIIKELEIGVNRISVSESESLDIVCGLQEMPWFITSQQFQEPLKKEEKIQETEWPTTYCSQSDGLNLIGSMNSINCS